MSTEAPAETIDSADLLAPDVRSALRDLILMLADNKRLLGIRYSDWMLGAPTLEAGIAASSMAQDEWGHGRLTYALLADFGEEPRELEHEREADGYLTMEPLDASVGSWSELVALALLVDTALAIRYDALADSRYAPVHNRVQKLLDEEAFHFQYAAGWARRIGRSPRVRDEFRDAVAALLPHALRWLGPEDPAAALLQKAGIVRGGCDELRDKLLACIGPVLDDAGLAREVGVERRGGLWAWNGELSWSGWDGLRRRGSGGGMDAPTLARIRGDKNRALLMD